MPGQEQTGYQLTVSVAWCWEQPRACTYQEAKRPLCLASHKLGIPSTLYSFALLGRTLKFLQSVLVQGSPLWPNAAKQQVPMWFDPISEAELNPSWT